MTWPEVSSAKKENRHELVLTGAAISERITKDGLDNALFNLNALNFLNISETCLMILPDDLGKLTNLQTLVLHSNKLESLPKTVNKLLKLKNLDISRNNLTELPRELSDLQQLCSINASSNSLTSIPCLSGNIKLSTLDFANNKLQVFPDICYAELVHLAEIKLNKNHIENIPGDVNKLTSLKIFDMSENNLKTIPYEVYECSKLKELNLKDNPISDKRLLKLVDQCRPKQVLDYIKQNCSKCGAGGDVGGGGGGSNKGGNKKNKKLSNTKRENEQQQQQRKSESEEQIIVLTHKINVLHVHEQIANVKITDHVKSVRPHIICCIVNNLEFDESSFKKFIQIQTKLHDSVCEKRNAATIATHDLNKLVPGDLTYTAKLPDEVKIQPLMRSKQFTGAELFSQLQTEAENLRKEKKRNVYSGIHRFLYLLEGKPLYPCLLDNNNQVISFPPITNSDITKMSVDTKSMFVEVTSASSQGVCRKVLDTLLYEILFLGIGDNTQGSSPEQNQIKLHNKYHSLTIQQVKIVDLDGNMKAVYPSRTDLIYPDKNITVVRE